MFLAKNTYSGELEGFFDVLFSTSDTVRLITDERGIAFEKMPTNGSLISGYLPAESFDEYVFTFDGPQYNSITTYVNPYGGEIPRQNNKTTVTLGIPSPGILDIIISTKEDDGSPKSGLILQYVPDKTKIDADPKKIAYIPWTEKLQRMYAEQK